MDFDLGLSMHAKFNLRSKQGTNAMFKVIRNPYKCVAFKLSSYVALEHRLQQYMGVCKTRQCVVEKQLTHRGACMAEERQMHGHALMYRYVLSIRKPQFRTMLKEKLCNRAMILKEDHRKFLGLIVTWLRGLYGRLLVL